MAGPNEEWHDGNDCPDGEKQERGACRLPCRAPELVWIDTQLFARHRVERRGLVFHQSFSDLPCLRLGHALRLIDERQLLSLFCWIRGNLAAFDGNLPLVQLA